MIPADVIAQSLRAYAEALHEAQSKRDWAAVDHVKLELFNCAGLFHAIQSSHKTPSDNER
jgi:hypothetical protein